MPSKSPSIASSYYHSSSSNDSFCLTSNYPTSLSELHEDQPTESPPKLGNKNYHKLSNSKPPLAASIEFLPQSLPKHYWFSNPDHTVYSFNWTNTVSSSKSFKLLNPFNMATANVPNKINHWIVPPTLPPPPTLWSTFTQSEIFAE